MKKKLSILAATLLFAATTFAQSVLPNETLIKVSSSVFEVIVDKHEDTTVSYEKELPLDKIAFAIRNDKYNPIGTAFLLEDGTFWSAAHVFTLYGESYNKNYYLRDADGEIYKIDEITSFSNDRDYISFTVPDYEMEEGQGLVKNEKTKMNTNVFSVGNALGEGIIIRNGILTSRTYESRNGNWQWLRFSAAASPGNSGGPLINDKGEVIGIITMKSENENLNYALPIAETKADPANTGIIDSPIYYSLPNIVSEKEYDEFKMEVKLPMKYEELHATLTQAHKEFVQNLYNKMSAKFAPDGEKGLAASRSWPDFAFYSYATSFPYTIYRAESGDWDLGNNNSKTYSLKENGSVVYSSMMGYFTAEVSKPDSIALKDFVASPKMYMDYALEAYKLHRTVGTEQIAITSFGNPVETTSYTDTFGRTWQVSYFDVKFADAMVLCYALPIPTGVYLMYKIDSISDIKDAHYLDMQFVADNYYASIYGKLKNWKEYLALPESLTGKKPAFEKDMSMLLTETQFKFKTSAFEIHFTPDIFKTDDDTKLELIVGFTKDAKNKVSLDFRGFTMYNSKKADGYKYVGIRKYNKPHADAEEQITQSWEQFINKVSPYDGQPYNNEQYTYRDVSFTLNDSKDPDSVYLLFSELKNQNRFEEVIEFSNKVKEAIILK